MGERDSCFKGVVRSKSGGGEEKIKLNGVKGGDGSVGRLFRYSSLG